MDILKNKSTLVFAALFLMMAATRSHHFSSALHLPDASLAVFFLAGFFIKRLLALPILLITAGTIDYLSITYGNSSGWCVSSAYWFLIPTYASLWFGGRWFKNHLERSHEKNNNLTTNLLNTIVLFVTAWLSTTVAFIISNGSFYTISGRYSEPHWAEYIERFGMYYPPYLSSAFTYIIAIAVLYVGVKYVNSKSSTEAIEQ